MKHKTDELTNVPKTKVHSNSLEQASRN